MAKAGDFVYVDAKVFVASRVPTGVLYRCEVLEDSGPSQTYLVKSEGGGGSPLYVFNSELRASDRELAESAEGCGAEAGVGIMAHTPGPWYVDGKLIRGLASGRIAQVGGDFYDDGRRDADGWTFTPPLDTDSNARLIAAAPELLAALIELRNAVTSDGTDTQHNACRMADAAISQATGGE